MSPSKNIDQAIKDFILEWGQISTCWGIPKTMGQIHGLFLVSHKTLNAKEIMDRLDLSRGNVHMQIQQLLEWDLIYKIQVEEDRKEYFKAEKDMWKLFIRVIELRTKLELNPLLNLLENDVIDYDNSDESKEFEKVTKDIEAFSHRTNKMLGHLIKLDNFWALSNIARSMEKA